MVKSKIFFSQWNQRRQICVKYFTLEILVKYFTFVSLPLSWYIAFLAMARPLQIYNESRNGNDNCKCTQIECISYRDFPSLFQLPKSFSWIERIAVLPWWYRSCYLRGISHNWSCLAAYSLPKDPSRSTCNSLLSYAFVPQYCSLVFKECHLWLDMYWSSVLWVRKMFTFYIKQN